MVGARPNRGMLVSRTGRRARRASALLLTLGLLLASCGGDSEGGSASDPSSTEASGSELDPAGVVRAGYDLVSGNRGGVQLDPAKSGSTAADEGLLYLIHGRLLRPSKNDATQLVPDLAESATVLDPSTIEVVIRDGVTFQDGEAFDAAAVKAGLERSLAANNRVAFPAAFFDLQSVEIVDPSTVRLTIANSGAAGWYSYLGSFESTIVRPDLDPSKPVGAGPMRLVSWSPESSMELEKWDGYWDAESVLVGGVELMHVPSQDTKTAIAALQSDQIDVNRADVTALPALTGDLSALIEPDPNALVSITICKRDAPLADADFREAVSKAIDREAISEAAYEGTAQPASQLWPEGHPYYDPDLADAAEFDPDGARELLADAGYADGAEFDVYVQPSVGLPDVAQIIQQQLEAVGVKANLIISQNILEQFYVPQPSAASLGPSAQTGRRRVTWVGEQTSNVCRYDDPEMNALSRELATVQEGSDEAIEVWHEVSALAVEDTLTIFVVFSSRVLGYNSDHLGELAAWPIGNVVIPDVRATTVKADS
jgi:peptide/nickel transport system substrate-binding protein